MGIPTYGIIFDLDGTIWDSVEYRIKAWKQALHDYGIDTDPEIIRLLIGYPGTMLIKAVNGRDPNIEKSEEEYFGNYINYVKFFPDVDKTFKELKNMGFKIAIVTSSRRAMVSRLKINVDAIVTMDDVKNGKPDVEPYLKALEIMNVGANNAVAVGDIDNDLIPAKRLGMTAVFVTHGAKKDADHKDFSIVNIYDVINVVKKRFNL
ncbi:HAD family hydrolase [Acidiplasma cupricumulans]|uniref:Phosphatase n=1 Tax=Acidiplasma cupricumulans TaxID=312540 RepID=A0A0Q0VQR1_9ARCH|nr:HAD-IA family hydrolase [Acidiplasma cupricumulans]KQB36210.1 phosphatase [Acidiplasma cupricumulans]